MPTTKRSSAAKKRSSVSRPGRPGSQRGGGASARTAAPPRGFGRLLYGTIAVLLVLTGGLAVANFAADPALVSESTAYRSTADFEVYALQRNLELNADGEKTPDTIRGDTVSGASERAIVFSAPRIQEFVALPGFLAVATLGEDDTSTLEIVSLTEGTRHSVRLPAAGRVENLRADPAGTLIGFSFTAADPAAGSWRSLFTVDVTARTEAPREVAGLNGEPISAWNLLFVPDTGSLVVQTDDRSIFLVDVQGPGTVSPLGQHAEMLGFIPGTSTLAVADATSNSTIDLTDGTVAELRLRPTEQGPDAFEGKTVVLDTAGRYARVISEYDQGVETSVVTVTDQAGSAVLFQPEAGWSRIGDLCVSPDGRSLSVETLPADAAGDGYPNLLAFSPVRTVVVDLETGRTTRTLAGFLSDWCR